MFLLFISYPFDKITSEHGRLSQLTRRDVLDKFGSETSKVLGFGAMFWMYGFGKVQPYPLEGYVNYMDVDIYRHIVEGLQVSENLYRIVTVARAHLEGYLDAPVFVTRTGQTSTGELLSALISSIKNAKQEKAPKDVIAIHVRRGDYWNKCKHIKDLKLRAHCYPSVERIEEVLNDYVDSRKSVLNLLASDSGEQMEIPDKNITIYIATNIGGSRAEFDGLVRRYNVFFFQDLFITDEARSGLDPSQNALIDVELCSHATMFFGNFYSSFSRSIFEQRERNALQSSSF